MKYKPEVVTSLIHNMDESILWLESFCYFRYYIKAYISTSVMLRYDMEKIYLHPSPVNQNEVTNFAKVTYMVTSHKVFVISL